LNTGRRVAGGGERFSFRDKARRWQLIAAARAVSGPALIIILSYTRERGHGDIYSGRIGRLYLLGEFNPASGPPERRIHTLWMRVSVSRRARRERRDCDQRGNVIRRKFLIRRTTSDIDRQLIGQPTSLNSGCASKWDIISNEI